MLFTAAAAVLSGLLGACSPDSPEEAAGTIDRARFVETYVALRAAALESEERVLSDAERAAVLARHGVTEEELVAFAEAHGRNVDLMAEVWNEVEARMDTMRSASVGR